MKQYLLEHRVTPGSSFVNLLRTDTLPFKIPITNPDTCIANPDFFERGNAEYGETIDVWLRFKLTNYASETSVVAVDNLWIVVMKDLCNVDILIDEHDASSMPRIRPDFTAAYNSMLVMKGEAKASAIKMVAAADDLITKFHPTAYLMFPAGCKSIPAVTTSNERIDLYSLAYNGVQFTMKLERSYNMSQMLERVFFVRDLFNIMRWIVSQSRPRELFHLFPGVRTHTRNGHYVTFTGVGILKEFDHSKLAMIDMEVIQSIYDLKLPNVEHGKANHVSVSISRVGVRLKDVFHKRKMDKEFVLEQVELAVQQLHSHGFAHCDICIDNLFVDTDAEAKVFIGDLEFCRRVGDAPPAGIRRTDERATTAEELDGFQLQELREELSR